MELAVKNLSADAGNVKRSGFDSWVRKVPWRRAWQLASVFLPEESHGQDTKQATVHGNPELDTTE